MTAQEAATAQQIIPLSQASDRIDESLSQSAIKKVLRAATYTAE